MLPHWQAAAAPASHTLTVVSSVVYATASRSLAEPALAEAEALALSLAAAVVLDDE